MKNGGFTLIELLVVVAIIGILAALAIPQFQAYRQRGYDAGAQSDIKSLANAIEAYLIENETLIDCSDASDCQSKFEGFVPTTGVTIRTELFPILGQNHYDIYGEHDAGSGKEFNYCSGGGGMAHS